MSASTRFLALLSFIYIALIRPCLSLGSTDTITWGGSNDRTGYEENHNMDPAVVSSQQFGLLFRTALPAKNPSGGPEQIFASPLVYTATDGIQYVYVATTMNNIYKIHAKNGTIVASRNVGRPFLQTDLGTCTDISPVIGVTATGVIDAATGTWYFTSKTYVDQDPNGATGRPNGRYYVHGVSTDDLSEVPNYPIDIEFTVARNNPVRSFTGGIHHQRPGLLLFNSFIYVGFASHCIQYNYTGWIMGFQKDAGQLVEAYAMEGAGIGSTTSGAGVWMSGGGLASNGIDSIFWASGNGQAYQLDQSPVNGRTPPTSLEEAAVHAIVNSDGTITPIDFFMPWEKVQLDGADKDLGTSPLQLLPNAFSCGNIQRIGMVTGKSGKTYWLNLDDMGGYRNGPNRLDNVIQVYQHENSVYAGAGVYPLEGGYIYVNVINYPTRVFQFTCQDGIPYFNPVSTTNETNAGRLSVGHGTVTSLGQPGTGLLWVSDMDGSNLRIYNPVPDVNGQMTLLNSFATPGVTKFSKLSFGDGAVYQITSAGYLYAYGSPVNLPMDCEEVQFPPTNLNSSSDPQTVQCQAKTDLTITTASSPQNFKIQMPTLPLQVASGTNFSFQATFVPTQLGGLSSSLFLNTTQAASGYTTTTQIQLRGTAQSQNPVLAINPPAVTWNGVITGESVNQTVVLSNLGNGNLTITSIQYSTTSETGPWITPNGTDSAVSVGPFTFFDMPSVIAPNSAYTAPINFNPTVSGGYAVYIQLQSNGGTAVFDTFATGADYPVALLEFEGLNGTWTKYDNTTAFSFGDVYAGDSRNLRLRLTNVGGSNAAPISVTVSKPPFGIAGSILGASNGVDLGEGQLINTGQNKTANMFCAPPKSQVNEASYSNSTTWTMNLNDPTFGHQVIQFVCNVVTPQVGPVLSNGTSQYEYAGCYKEYNPGRQLQIELYSDANNTDDRCITQCAAAGYIFAGTQFQQECWCGNNRPLTIVDDANCNYECSGDVTEVCGGNGIDHAETYISLFGDRTRWDGNTTEVPGPYTNPGAYGFSTIGCWTDSTTNRTLSNRVTANSTVATCLQACQGYQYAGVEFGGECYCDNTILSSAQQAPLTDCSQTCNNNYTEFCGASSRLDLYQFGLNASTTSSSTIATSIASTTTFSTSLSTTVSSSTTASSTTLTQLIQNSTSSTLSSTSSTLAATSLTTTSSSLVSNSTSVFSSTSSSLPESSSSLSTTNLLVSTTTSTGPTSSLSTTSSPGLTSSSASSSSTALLNALGPVSLLLPSTSSTSSSSSSTLSSTSSTLSSTSSTLSSASSNLLSTSSALSSTSITSSSASSALSSTSSTLSSTSSFLSSTTSTSSSVSSTYLSTASSSIAAASLSSSSTASPVTSSLSPLSTSSSLGTSSIPLTSSLSSTQLSSDASSSSFTTIVSSSLTTTAASSSSVSSTTASQIVSSSLPYSSSVVSTSLSSSSSSVSFTATSVSSTASSSSSTLTTSISSSGSPTAAFLSSSTPAPSSSSSISSSATSASSGPASSATSSSTTLTTSSSTTSTTVSSITSTTVSSITSTTSSSTTSTTLKTSTTSAQSSSSPTIVRNPPGFAYTNCYTEAVNIRALSDSSLVAAGMTVEKCASFCSGYTYMAVEFSDECYCGNKINVAQGGVPATDGRCKMACAGDSTEICGGSYGLTLYTTSLPYVGCAVDQSARTLNGAQTSASDMTVEKCLAFCGTSYALAGTEYGSECYCGGPSITVGASGCTSPCSGNSAEQCGGSWRLSVYNNTAYIPPVTKSPLSGYTYKGCFYDSSQRVLNGYATASSTMTQEVCVATCKSKGFKVAGVEYGRECWCGSSIPVLQAADGDCSMRCTGDSTELCGAGLRLNVWSA